MSGERFDSGRSEQPGNSDSQPRRRRFLGVHFSCCHVYARVYVNPEGTHYAGFCPRCARPVRFRIGPGGTSERFFTAY